MKGSVNKNARWEKLEAKLDHIDQAMGILQQVVGTLQEGQSGLTQRFDGLAQNTDCLAQSMDAMKTVQERFEDKLDSVSRSVCIIEKEHGAKLDALFDGCQLTNDRLGRLESDVSVLKGDVSVLKADNSVIKADVRDIKRGMGVLQAIASDHETRIQATENTLRDHLHRP